MKEALPQSKRFLTMSYHLVKLRTSPLVHLIYYLILKPFLSKKISERELKQNVSYKIRGFNVQYLREYLHEDLYDFI